MDEKSLQTLEYPKVLERLAAYTAFKPSYDKAIHLIPTAQLAEARRRQALTREARQLLAVQDLSIGGARDIFPSLDAAKHEAVLDPHHLLDIRSTILSARSLVRTFERQYNQYPHLYEITMQMPTPMGLAEAISRAISEHGEVLDSASEKLAAIRTELRLVHDRLFSRLQRMINDPEVASYLQESFITQRDGRYVIPLRAECKGRVKAIVHDQSASGATLFVEPLSVLELNNKYRQLQLEEKNEERRILAYLSSLVAQHYADLLHTVDAIAEIDLALACAKYAIDLDASEPLLKPITPPQNVATPHPGSLIRLWQARHPLLDPQKTVPIDVEICAPIFAMVITGPNTGGKTVSLKTIGLLVLMAQSGLHIPAQSGSEITIFDNVFADIGDEQSIEQSLSTFSGHINNIIHILKKANQRSLVILDELGAGTDPQEGAALARAILSYLAQRNITTLVTTHHPELKAYAHLTPGVTNASVEFNLETLQPTFHLTIGLPGRSNALAIAERLGLPKDIIETARAEISPSDLRAEDLLDEIHRQRELARSARQAAEQAYKEAQALRTELAQRLEKIEAERKSVLEEAYAKAQQDLEALSAEIRQLRRMITRTRQSAATLQPIEEKLKEVEEMAVNMGEELHTEPDLLAASKAILSPSPPIRPGTKVRLRKLGTRGVVLALNGDEVELQVGMMHMRAHLSDLESCESEAEETTTTDTGKRTVLTRRGHQPTHQSATSGLLPPSPGIELDLRGRRVDEALAALDQYLDTAFLAGLPFVRIIHGKGTGRLREAIRSTLNHHPHVKSHEPGLETEGGEGVTVVKLA